MKNFNKLGYIAIGIVFTIIIGTATPAFAVSKDVVKQLTAYFTSGGKPISVYVNGTKITPKDGNGKEVAPFTVDGTTYLPVRAIADALGKSVAWDGAAASVKIADKTTSTPITHDSNNAKLTVTKDKNGVLHEFFEYTFTLDKDAVGEWKNLGWYETMSDFDPDQPVTDQKQWYLGQSIYADGTMTARQTAGDDAHRADRAGLHWTKGFFVDLMTSTGMDTIPAYSIIIKNGKTYMFLEWKSGDYTIRGEKPSYFVFEKTSDTPALGINK